MKKKQTIKFIWKIIKKYKWKQLLGLVLTILCAIMYFFGPMFSQYLIDSFTLNFSLKVVMPYIIAFVLILLLQPIIQFFQKNVFINISEELSSNLINDTFEKTLNNRLLFFEKKTKGEILSRLIDDTQKVSVFVSDIFVVLIKNLFTVISILCGMFYYSWIITTIILMLMIILVAIIVKFDNKISKASREAKLCFDKKCSLVNDVFYNISIIKIYGLIQIFNKKFNSIVNENRKSNIRLKKLSNKLNFLSEIFTVGCICIIYLFGFILIFNNRMTLGTVMAMVLYFQMMLTPLFELLNSNFNFQAIIPNVERILEYTENEKNVKLNCMKGYKERIRVKNLCFSYDKETILENINVLFETNSFISIIGASGSGKTTFVKLLLNLLKAESGEIYFGNERIEKFDITNTILLVPQNIHLFNLSIMDNIRCGNNNISDEDIYQVCSRIGIYNYIFSLENGFNTIINEELNFSRGQGQRITIARAVVRKPSVIIFDEPTSALDEENISSLIDLFKELSNECTIIVVTHNEQMKSKADIVYEIRNKKIFKL